MRAVCDDAATLQNMLDFEAALARAEAATGVIPDGAAEADRESLQGRPNSISRHWPRPRHGPAISRFPW